MFLVGSVMRVIIGAGEGFLYFFAVNASGGWRLIAACLFWRALWAMHVVYEFESMDGCASSVG